MDWVVKTLKIYFKMLDNPSILKDILALLYKYANTFAIGFEKKFQLSLIIDLVNDSLGSSECRDSTTINTVQVIKRRVVGRSEETSTYSSLGFCTVNCRPTASNYPDSIPTLAQCRHLRRSDIGCQRWANGFLTVGPTLAQRRQATGENYILCMASDNQMMFIDNFCSVNF